MRAHRRLSRTTDDLKRTAADLAVRQPGGRRRPTTSSAPQNPLLVEKENALHAQNMLFDAALNNMSQGLCMFDDAMRPIVFNTQFERLFHVRASAAGGPARRQ